MPIALAITVAAVISLDFGPERRWAGGRSLNAPRSDCYNVTSLEFHSLSHL